MKTAWTVAAIRSAEDAAMTDLVARGGDGGELMQRAAAALAARARQLLGRRYGAEVLLLCGPGNNAGDGLYAAERLLHKGIRVYAHKVFGRTHDQGWAAFLAAGGREIDRSRALAEISRVDLVVDAILGIGGRSGLSEDLAELARACAAPTAARLLAVDVPSGLDADAVSPTEDSFLADHTVTFGAARWCQLCRPAAARCGEVTVADIGLAPWLDAVDESERTTARLQAWEPADLAAAWPVPGKPPSQPATGLQQATGTQQTKKPTVRGFEGGLAPSPWVEVDKYSRGVLGIDAGSQQYPGAGRLVTAGAVHSGPGMVRFAGPEAAASLAAHDFPNIVPSPDADHPGRVQAWLVGSGWGERADGVERLDLRAADGVPMVLDADALPFLGRSVAAEHQSRTGSELLLTPHAGELARLLGVERSAVQADPIGHARTAAARFAATVLLKGATQYVVCAGGQVQLAVPGPAWTAQAGSGDVLAGICGTLLAAGLAAGDAATAAASVQALAAQQRPGPLAPQELAATLPGLVARLATGRMDP